MNKRNDDPLDQGKGGEKNDVHGAGDIEDPPAQDARPQTDQPPGEAVHAEQACGADVLDQADRHAGERRLDRAGQQSDDVNERQGKVGLDPGQGQRVEERRLDGNDQKQYREIHAGFHFLSTSASSMRERLTAGCAITVWNAFASCFDTLTTVATGRPLG